MDVHSFKIRLLMSSDLKETGRVIITALLPRLKKQGLSENDVKVITTRYSPENMKQQVEGKCFFVAEDERKKILVGVGGLRKDDGSLVPNRLTTFYVLPIYQRMGIGQRLYEFLRNEAIKKGCKKLVVSSSPEAELFYKHLGFVKKRIDWKEFENGRKYYNVWMEKDLFVG